MVGRRGMCSLCGESRVWMAGGVPAGSREPRSPAGKHWWLLLMCCLKPWQMICRTAAVLVQGYEEFEEENRRQAALLIKQQAGARKKGPAKVGLTARRVLRRGFLDMLAPCWHQASSRASRLPWLPRASHLPEFAACPCAGWWCGAGQGCCQEEVQVVYG